MFNKNNKNILFSDSHFFNISERKKVQIIKKNIILFLQNKKSVSEDMRFVDGPEQ